MNFKLGTETHVFYFTRDTSPFDLCIMTLFVVPRCGKKKEKKKNGPTKKSPVCHVLYLGTYVQ